MGDTVVVTEDPEPEPETTAEVSQVESAVLAASQAATATAVTEQAREASYQAQSAASQVNEGVETAGRAAGISVDAAASVAEAEQRITARALEIDAALERHLSALGNLQSQPAVDPMPAPETATADVAPSEDEVRPKSHFLNRRWGGKRG